MATKRFYATRDFRNPSYATRMLKAGDPVELTGPQARLYLALGAVSATKPKEAKPVEDDVVPAMTTEAVATPTPANPRAPRKRKAKK